MQPKSSFLVSFALLASFLAFSAAADLSPASASVASARLQVIGGTDFVGATRATNDGKFVVVDPSGSTAYSITVGFRAPTGYVPTQIVMNIRLAKTGLAEPSSICRAVLQILKPGGGVQALGSFPCSAGVGSVWRAVTLSSNANADYSKLLSNGVLSVQVAMQSAREVRLEIERFVVAATAPPPTQASVTQTPICGQGFVERLPIEKLAAIAVPASQGEPPRLAGITSAHNSARASLYGNTAPLAWNPRLAAIAQEWANYLQSQCTACGKLPMRHRTNLNGQYGENQAWYMNIYPPASETVKSWVAERAYYDYARATCAAGQMCGHYTQVVWKTTRELGCGYARCSFGTGGQEVIPGSGSLNIE
eukprot:tig00000057_g69.t1